VPANGYQAFGIGASIASPETTPLLQVSTNNVESAYWKIELNDRGRITRLYDKRVGREVVPAIQLANRLVVFEDKPLNYDAWHIDAYHVAKSVEVDALETVEVKESGAERAMLEFKWRIDERSRVVQRMCVYARSSPMLIGRNVRHS